MKVFNYNYKSKNKKIKSIDKTVQWWDFKSYQVFTDHVLLKNYDDVIIGKISYDTLSDLQDNNFI